MGRAVAVKYVRSGVVGVGVILKQGVGKGKSCL